MSSILLAISFIYQTVCKLCDTASFAREAYRYDILPRGEHFRYLTLEPGVDDEPLQCSLHTAIVSEASFEAISYVWGSYVKDQEIVCEGHVVKITTNLHNVLRRVRLPDTPRNLYADGICIDQDNKEEKGHQVGLMGNIYRMAERVLIYMGPDDDGDGQNLCSLLDDVCGIFENTLKTIDMSWNSFPHPAKGDSLFTDTRCKSFRTFLDQDWFERGWVVQEAGLAQEGLVIWGKSTFSWHELMKLCCYIQARASSFSQAYDLGTNGIMLHTELYRHRHKSQLKVLCVEFSYFPLFLLEFLRGAKRLDLSDQRDRIYAFVEILQKSERTIEVYPDYSLSFLEVYQQFAMEYVRTIGDIDILAYVVHDEQSLDSGIPSWIPRWDIPVISVAMSRSQSWPALMSRTQSISKLSMSGDANLKVHGVIFDSICYVSDALQYSTTTVDTFSNIWRAINTLGVKMPYPTPFQFHAFLDLLCRGMYIGKWSTWSQSKAAFFLDVYQKSGQMGMTDSLPSTLGTEVGESNVFLGVVKKTTNTSRVFVTKRGYMGLCPSMALEGDLCAIIFGSTTPCVLRRASEKEGYLKFMGASDIMGKEGSVTQGGEVAFYRLGLKESKDWEEWDVEEQDIYLC